MGPGKRGKAYKYRPQPFYEPADTQAAAENVAEDRTFRQPSSQSTRAFFKTGGNLVEREERIATTTAVNGKTGQIYSLRTRSNDWETLEQAAQATPRPHPQGGETVGTTAGAGIGSWLFGNRKAAEEEQVNRSWQELSDDWDDVEGRDYRARGVSPVDDNLDDINRGWDDPRPPQPCQDFEVPQSPKRVYQDGSIYSYSYRNQDSTGQRDNIYGPPDDAVYDDDDFDRQGYINLSQPEDYGDPPAAGGPSVDYGSDGYPGQDLNEPENGRRWGGRCRLSGDYSPLSLRQRGYRQC